jgi:hypothetical protein
MKTERLSRLAFGIVILGLLLPAAGYAEGVLDFRGMTSGLIIPLDDQSMYVRNPEGQFEVRFQSHTEVAIKLSYVDVREMSDTTIRFQNHKVLDGLEIALPAKQAYARFYVRRQEDVARIAETRVATGWEKCNLHIYYEPVADNVPDSPNEAFAGKFFYSDDKRKPARLIINGKTYSLMLNKSREVLIHNVWGVIDCRPFVNDAFVSGKQTDGVVLADDIYVTPLGDSANTDDPDLARYLFIGDSISGNYDASLRAALKGRFNLHHPPTNCGPSIKGRANIVSWLGAYGEKGRHWDVISFNHGHWDSSNTKAGYQSNLEAIITELKKTKAKLVWVTTCPVPGGTDPVGALGADGRAPGRKTGVMEKYLNPWALEVIRRHPQISVCDQWQLVKDGENGVFKEWWDRGHDVHFGGEQAQALGEYLARHIEKVMKPTK